MNILKPFLWYRHITRGVYYDTAENMKDKNTGEPDKITAFMFTSMVYCSGHIVSAYGLFVFNFEMTELQTTARFIELAKAGWYNGKSFYRVVKGHVAQAGINDDNHPDHQKYRVPAEFSDKLPHIRGSLGMARDEDPNSGSTEFFICLERRAHLDGKYTNFGQLSDGDKVLDAFAALPVDEKWIDNPGAKPIAFHSPKQPVLIKQIRIEL